MRPCSEFSVGWSITEKERAAITAIPKTVWADAIDADGGHRDGAGLAEITRVLPARALAGYPRGTRVIVRRERPHPGAQLDAFEEADGWRYTAFATDTRFGQLASLDTRHRAHARAEDPALPAAARRRTAHPRPAPALAAHPTDLARARHPAAVFARLAALPVPAG